MHSGMKISRFIWLVLAIGAGVFAVGGSWYAYSPRLAIAALSDWEAAPEELLAFYDRPRVRAAFERQMLPQVDTYGPPYTKDVVLDAMSDPRAVRMFVNEPYGEWQFAAAAGLPEDFPDREPAGSMPRIMETTDSWSFDWSGPNKIVATPSGRNETSGNSYRFERDGLIWRLVAIDLTVLVR
ncbi:MAG: hypothetical protein DI637_03115 [Citromicrobium sp.]|nr:MAG: hypothetical protein DI637_03115 [Citromicrobium sp.]